MRPDVKLKLKALPFSGRGRQTGPARVSSWLLNLRTPSGLAMQSISRTNPARDFRIDLTYMSQI